MDTIFSCDRSSIGRNVGRSATIEFQKHIAVNTKVCSCSRSSYSKNSVGNVKYSYKRIS